MKTLKIQTSTIVAFLLFAILTFIACNIIEAQSLSEKQLLKIQLREVCKELGINPSYTSRYDNIIIPLCENGITLFTGELNPYYYSSYEPFSCRWYIGTIKQNQKLKINLIKNRHLIEKGKLIPEAYENWAIYNEQGNKDTLTLK